MTAPVVDLPVPWETPVDDWLARLASARAEHGDTFVVATERGHWLFVFGPIGVPAFYALDEAVASKGVADWLMLRRKLPPELFADRRTLPHELFGRSATRAYLDQLDAAIAVSFAELDDADSFEVFEWSRRLGHRMGLASWAGMRPERGERFERLVAAFDRIDGAAAFVDPAAMAHVAASDYAAERAALAELERDLVPPGSLTGRPLGDDLFSEIVARWSDAGVGAGAADAERGVARDVILVHLGSMSNLFAALGWTVVHLLLHPAVLARVRAGDDALAERAALESTRLAQRSLMSRAVLQECTLDTDAGPITLVPGDSVATVLAVTNTTAAPGLERYEPDRWERRRLRGPDAPEPREMVTTFGHGAHTCPAQPFSLAAIVAATTRLVREYDLVREFGGAVPRPGQIGGVARAAAPCSVRHSRRAGHVAG